MIHPVLTLLFDAFLIGSTLTIVIGIAAETRLRRGPTVGANRRHHAAQPLASAVAHRPHRAARRRGVLARSA